MKITITAPDNFDADVVKYCLKEGIDLQDRMQQELNDFVRNAVAHMERERQIREDLDRLARTFTEAWE